MPAMVGAPAIDPSARGLVNATRFEMELGVTRGNENCVGGTTRGMELDRVWVGLFTERLLTESGCCNN